MATALRDSAFPNIRPHLSIFQIAALARRQVRLILGKKQQNQQNSAREHAHKSLELGRIR
jgi:hypothetical protein